MCENCNKVKEHFNKLIDLLKDMVLHPIDKAITVDTREKVANQFEELKLNE